MKRKLYILALTFLMIISSVSIVSADTPIIDISLINEGVVKVNYKSDKQLAVVVEKGEKREQYILSKNNTSIPLQLGDGAYLIKTLEHKEGTTYKVVDKTSINVKLINKNSVYLQSIQQINFDKEQPVIKKANELTKGFKTDQAKLARIYTYVISNIVYDYDKVDKLTNTYLPSINDTFATNKGICYDYASMMAGMLRSQGIPTKLVKGYSNNVDEYHAWNEVYINGQWRIIDTTADATYYEHRMDFNMYKSSKDYNNITGYY